MSEMTAASPRAVLTRYLAAAALARMADDGARVGLVLLALDRGSGVGLGGALVAGFLAPHILAAPAVGALADHVRQRKTLHLAALLIVASALAGCAVSVGRVPAAVSVLIAVVGGCAGPLITGGMSSLPALMLPARMLPQAYSADGATYNIGSVAGPAVAAVAASAWNAQTAVLLLAGFILASAAMLATLPVPDGAARPDGATDDAEGASLANFGRGLAVMWHSRTLRVVTVASTVSQLGAGSMPIVAALLAARYGDAHRAGLLLSTYAVAGLVGALLNAWRPFAAARPDLLAALSLVGTGVPLAAVTLVHSLAASTALFALAGLAAGPFIASLLNVRQQHSPDAYRTQIFMVAAGLRSAVGAVGAAVAGSIAGIGVGRLVVLAGLVQVASGVVALWRVQAARAAGSGAALASTAR
jgi:MFS family permease